MTSDEIVYFEKRAETQISLAQRSTDTRAVQAHYQLACHYLDLIPDEARAREE